MVMQKTTSLIIYSSYVVIVMHRQITMESEIREKVENIVTRMLG